MKPPVCRAASFFVASIGGTVELALAEGAVGDHDGGIAFGQLEDCDDFGRDATVRIGVP